MHFVFPISSSLVQCIDYTEDTKEDTYMKPDEFKAIKSRGKPVSNLKQHKKIPAKFLVDFRHNGKRYRQTIRVLNDGSNPNMIQKAIVQRDEIMTSKNDDVNSTVANMRLDQYFDRYITARSISNKWSDKYLADTKRAYKLYVKDKLGKKKITAIRATHITNVMDGVAHLSLRSQKLVIDLLKPLFKKAIQDDCIIIRSPIQSSHMVTRNASEEKKIVTNAEQKYKLVHQSIHQLFGSTDKIVINDKKTIQCSMDPRNRALLLFGFYGRRKMETLKLKWSDVDLDSGIYAVRAENSKVGTTMTFQLPSDLITTLRELQKLSNKSIYIFESIIKRGSHQTQVNLPVMKLRQVTGIKDLTYHWLRNLAVSALSAKGVEAIHLSSMLGHTDINTVNKYLSLQREASSAVTNSAVELLLEEGK